MTSPTTFSLPERVFHSGEIPLAEVCRRAGVPLSNSWNTEQFFRIWAAADRMMDDRAAGLRLGAGGIDKGYGIASIVALHAPDFRSALKALSRYKQLTCPELVAVEVRGDEAAVRYRWLEASGPVPRLLVDTTMASLAALALRGTGGLARPVRVELARRPADVSLLRRHFECDVVFEAEHDAMVFEASALDAPFVSADAGAFSSLVADLEARLRAGSTETGLRSAVRTAIARQLSEGRDASVAAVAGRLNLSTRTLQRRLGEAGTRFQAELSGVRHIIANRLLVNTQLDPVAIAMMVGFVEPNSFARAYRAWEHTTPQQWRLQHGATPA